MYQRTIVACAAALACAACSSEKSCKSARDCDPAQRCVSSVCRASADTLGQLGDSCVSQSECGPGLTCNVAASGFPNGFCTVDCTTMQCASGSCAGLASGATCAPACSSDADCRNGYSCCVSLGDVCVPSSACLPAACTRPVQTSSLPAAQVIAFGTQPVGKTVSFPVPAGTSSITIVHQAKIANLDVVYQGQVIGNSAVPGQIVDPNGKVVYDDNDPKFQIDSSSDGGVDPSGLPATFGTDSPSTAAFTVPNTTAGLDAGIPAGTWKFIVNDYAYECTTLSGCSDGGSPNNTYDVSVLLKGDAGTSGNVDVNFYIIADATTLTGQPLNAATATTDPTTQRMVNTFKGLYAAAHVNVRTVTFYDVSEAVKAQFGTRIDADLTGPCDLLDQMFLLSSDHPGNAINLFLVQSITSKNTGGGSVVGIDGTIPGPASLAGTVHSGAAVSLADLFSGTCTPTTPDLRNCGADLVAFIAAHEMGHFLGLFHTTESDGRFFDPLTDTAKCPCTLCATSSDKPRCDTQTSSNPVFLQAPQCTVATGGCDGGGDNLMFWQLQPPASKGTLTSQQAAIMLRNPAVQ